MLNEKEEVIGYAFSVLSHDGYGGDIDVCIGISLDKTITGVEIISLNETPGMGMRATEPAFIEQYKDKKVDAFVVTKTGKSAGITYYFFFFISRLYHSRDLCISKVLSRQIYLFL